MSSQQQSDQVTMLLRRVLNAEGALRKMRDSTWSEKQTKWIIQSTLEWNEQQIKEYLSKYPD